MVVTFQPDGVVVNDDFRRPVASMRVLVHRALVTGWTMLGTQGEGSEPDWGSLQRPDNEIPTSMAVDLVLGASEDVVVFVCGLSVYRHGIEFSVEARASGRRELSADDYLGAALHGHGGSRNPLLLGVEYADGSRCTNVAAGPHFERRRAAAGPVLWSTGGGGGPRDASATWFLSPLPPPGEVRLYCAWPAAGIDETVTVLDGDQIRAAAARARELWPRLPEPGPSEPPPVQVPEGGWFARHSGT